MTDCPRKPRNLPYDSIGTLFKGRDSLLQELHERAAHGSASAAVIAGKHGIHSLGGVGKSRLAVEYAHRHEAEHSALLFVAAETPEELRRNLAALCAPRVLSLPACEAKEEDVQVAAALRWLEEHPGWLLILDSVDTPEAVSEVERQLAALRSGQVLITSRISEWSGGVERLDLDVLGEDDAVAFLLERTGGGRHPRLTDASDARVLARELGGLALALEQAGAFVSRRQISLANYLTRWRERKARVREWHDETRMKYPLSVATTWDTTFEQLGPTERTILRILSWLAPKPIPREILGTKEARETIAQGVYEILGSTRSPQALRAALGPKNGLAELAGFSLVEWETENRAFRLHKLVREVTLDRLPVGEERTLWLGAALNVVLAYLPADPRPDDVRSWPLWDPMRIHVAAVIAAAEAAGVPHLVSRLMTDLGVLLFAKRLLSEAEHWTRVAFEIAEKSFGPDHPTVATRAGNLASLLQETNRPFEAEPLMRRALALTEKNFGPDDPTVAIWIGHLASLLQDTSRTVEAEALMRRALAINEKSLGPDHPDVATRLGNLARLLRATNRLSEAEPLMRRALGIDEKNFGPDHPRVSLRLSHLAKLLQLTKRFSEAEPLLRRALEIDERYIGPDHPEVATDLGNLAQLLHAMNRLSQAEPLMRRALEIDEKCFGPDHPEVARDLNILVQVLHATNRLSQAEPLMRRALKIDEKCFGPDHPTLAISLNNLASLLQDTNRFSEAKPLMNRGLAILFKVTAATGHQPPELRTLIGNYADLLEKMGRSMAEVRAQLEAMARPHGIQIEVVH